MRDFFKKVGEGARQAVNVVKETVESKAEEFQLRADIAAHKDDLEALFAELGRLAYHGSDAKAGVRPRDVIVSDIDTMTYALEALQEQLDAIMAEPEPKPVPEEKEPAAGFCHICGKPQAKGSKFCNQCGTKLK